jgi:PIN domain nuclease of toxin-antitoxin system
VIAYLDTNALLRLASKGADGIRSGPRAVLEKASVLVSPMVLLELEYLYELGRTRYRATELMRKLELESDFRVCDLPFALVTEVALGESWTRDPFDRMIVAQAKANGLALLVSSDAEIAAHYPRTIW